MRTLMFILLLSVMSSCTSISKKSRNIKVGFTKAEVEKIMGVADDVQTKGNKEAWQYCVTNFGHYVFSIVWFSDEVVTGTTSYNKDGRPASFCDSNFESIRWESSPDAVIEIRNR